MAAQSGSNEFKASSPGLIGKQIQIRGQLRGAEDLVVEGAVEGTIALTDNHLILERSAKVHADVSVKNVTIKGEMYGNTVAMQRVEIADDAWVKGDIKTPRLVVHEGAKFQGAVDMEVPLPAGLLDE